MCRVSKVLKTKRKSNKKTGFLKATYVLVQLNVRRSAVVLDLDWGQRWRLGRDRRLLGRLDRQVDLCRPEDALLAVRLLGWGN